MWVDPPYYFDGIVYPAYVKAFGHLFEKGDVEDSGLRTDTTTTAVVSSPGASGSTPDTQQSGAPVSGLVLMDALKMSADDLLDWACRELAGYVEQRVPLLGSAQVPDDTT